MAWVKVARIPGFIFPARVSGRGSPPPVYRLSDESAARHERQRLLGCGKVKSDIQIVTGMSRIPDRKLRLARDSPYLSLGLIPDSIEFQKNAVRRLGNLIFYRSWCFNDL